MSTLRKRFHCSALPKGWEKEEVKRRKGYSAGKIDVYYYSPEGKKIRSKVQLARCLGENFNAESFDYHAGKFIEVTSQTEKKHCEPQYSHATGYTGPLRTLVPKNMSNCQESVTLIGLQDKPEKMEGETDKKELNECKEQKDLMDFEHYNKEEILLPTVTTTLDVLNELTTMQAESEPLLDVKGDMVLKVDEPVVEMGGETDQKELNVFMEQTDLMDFELYNEKERLLPTVSTTLDVLNELTIMQADSMPLLDVKGDMLLKVDEPVGEVIIMGDDQEPWGHDVKSAN